MKIKTGSVEDFFNHHKEIAKKIDNNESVEASNTIWIEVEELAQIIKPERKKIINYLQQNKEVLLTDLINWTGRTRVSVNNDIKVLSRYNFLNVLEKPNPNHGIHKVISSQIYNTKMLLQAQI
jgi:predicted transcriptional regulator